MLTMIRTFIENRRRAGLAGCTSCGKKRIRYVYAGPWRGRMVPEDDRCGTCGPIMHNVNGVRVREVPLIDYGYDVEVTAGQMDDDVTARVR